LKKKKKKQKKKKDYNGPLQERAAPSHIGEAEGATIFWDVGEKKGKP